MSTDERAQQTPGMWEHADFLGGRPDVVRGPDAAELPPTTGQRLTIGQAVEALRPLEKDTTPGPWRADSEHSPVSPKILSACMIRADNEWPGPAMTRQLRDAAFIVAAVETVRAVLAGEYR